MQADSCFVPAYYNPVTVFTKLPRNFSPTGSYLALNQGSSSSIPPNSLNTCSRSYSYRNTNDFNPLRIGCNYRNQTSLVPLDGVKNNFSSERDNLSPENSIPLNSGAESLNKSSLPNYHSPSTLSSISTYLEGSPVKLETTVTENEDRLRNHDNHAEQYSCFSSPGSQNGFESRRDSNQSEIYATILNRNFAAENNYDQYYQRQKTSSNGALSNYSSNRSYTVYDSFLNFTTELLDSVDINSTSTSSSDGGQSEGKITKSKQPHPNSQSNNMCNVSQPHNNNNNNISNKKNNSGMGISFTSLKKLSNTSAASCLGIDHIREDPESIIDNHVSRVFCDSTQSRVNTQPKTADRFPAVTFQHQYYQTPMNSQQTYHQGNLSSCSQGLGDVDLSNQNIWQVPSIINSGLRTGEGHRGNPQSQKYRIFPVNTRSGGAPHKQIVADNLSSKSTSSGIDSGVYDAQSVGSSDSYGGKQAMVTHWVETHRQIRPELNTTTPILASNKLNLANGPLPGGFPGPISATRTSAESQNHYMIPLKSPSPLSSMQLAMSTVGPHQQYQMSPTNAFIYSSSTNVVPPRVSYQLSDPYTSGNITNTHAPKITNNTSLITTTSTQGRITSSSTQSPVFNFSIGSQNAQLNNTQQFPGTFQMAGRSGSNPRLNGSSSNASSDSEQTVVAYYFCNETIPYRTIVPFKNVTLGQFKALLTRKGKFRYFFKMRSNDIELGGVVQQEITEDESLLPLFDGKIIGKIEKQ